MKKIQVQGVHHTTIVGSTRQSAIDFLEGLLGMPFVLEQPNLGKPDETNSPATSSRLRMDFAPWTS